MDLHAAHRTPQSRQRPPDISICPADAEAAPVSPSDGGYATGGLPSATLPGAPPPLRFFPGGDEELEVGLDESDVLEDEVFEAENVEIERVLAVICRPGRMRSRALSFPFTLADLTFSHHTNALTLLQRRQFGSRFLHSPLLEHSPLRIVDGRGNGEEAEEDDKCRVDDIDDYEEAPGWIGGDSPARSAQHSPRNDASICRRLALPDLILSGTRNNQPDSPDSRGTHSSGGRGNMEFEIACRLAKIGDEFDINFFMNGDTPDGATVAVGSGLATVSRVWKYLSSCRSAGRKSTRQRSRSTTD